MPPLITEDQTPQPDELYQTLVDAHDGLSDGDSRQLNARLILLLANHIGDLAVIQDAVATARATLGTVKKR